MILFNPFGESHNVLDAELGIPYKCGACLVSKYLKVSVTAFAVVVFELLGCEI